jgi:hypothetical protein
MAISMELRHHLFSRHFRCSYKKVGNCLHIKVVAALVGTGRTWLTIYGHFLSSSLGRSGFEGFRTL